VQIRAKAPQLDLLRLGCRQQMRVAPDPLAHRLLAIVLGVREEFERGGVVVIWQKGDSTANLFEDRADF
jgi:hypothetical protein